jgi:hypothetical protein
MVGRLEYRTSRVALWMNDCGTAWQKIVLPANKLEIDISFYLVAEGEIGFLYPLNGIT